jgi:hypothetical protein
MGKQSGSFQILDIDGLQGADRQLLHLRAASPETLPEEKQ